MIVDENCKKCEAMKGAVARALFANGISAKVKSVNYKTDEAVNLAIRYDLSQVPSMVVNGVGFADFDEVLFLEALGRKI